MERVNGSQPSRPTGEAKYAGVCIAIAIDDVVALVGTKVPAAHQIDSEVVASIIAVAMGVGSFVGAELTIEGIAPPPEERQLFRESFPTSYTALQRVVDHTRETVAQQLADEQERRQ